MVLFVFSAESNESNRLRSNSCARMLANRTLSAQAKADSLKQMWILHVPCRKLKHFAGTFQEVQEKFNRTVSHFLHRYH